MNAICFASIKIDTVSYAMGFASFTVYLNKSIEANPIARKLITVNTDMILQCVLLQQK